MAIYQNDNLLFHRTTRVAANVLVVHIADCMVIIKSVVIGQGNPEKVDFMIKK